MLHLDPIRAILDSYQMAELPKTRALLSSPADARRAERASHLGARGAETSPLISWR